MKKALICLMLIPVLTSWGAIKSAYAWPETAYGGASGTTLTNLGANLRTVWGVAPGGSLGAAAPIPAASAVGMHVRDNLGVLAEFGTAASAGNQVAGLWVGYLYRNWVFPSVGLDSRYLFENAGIGPSASLSFLVPISDGSAGRLEARYSWFGDDGGGAVSLGFGYLGSF